MDEDSEVDLNQGTLLLAQEQNATRASQNALIQSFDGIENTLGELSPAITRRLYISHFLSTWNSRVFEFGAVLYLAFIFPKTLMSMSVYALVRGASAIVFSSFIGAYVDMGNRLQVVRLSIGGLGL